MYRDARQPCPRCGADLVDARAARGCPQCQGLWLGMPDLRTMALRMEQTPLFANLPFVTHARQALACPDCSEPMGTFQLFSVEVDRCDKHGVWFDPDELAQVLMAVWVSSASTS